MAEERRVSGSSLTAFTDAARNAFAAVPGDPDREGIKAAEVSRLWMTGGGFVGVPVFSVELRVLGDAAGEPTDEPGASVRATWSCDDWYAYHDFMPGSPPTLRVGAKCTARTSGYCFTLVPAAPQGTNPGDLLMHLLVEIPETANDVVTTYEVQYVEETDQRYDTVSIVPGGPTSIPVRIVE
jgi:hypothetical protein